MKHMGITSSTKELSAATVPCGGSFQVTLSLTAAPDISANPTDIVLILDRSGSMAGSPLDSLKAAAKKFIDIIDESTDGDRDGHIGGGSHIGIVSFATTATQNTPLTTSVAELTAAVEALRAMGSTNHEDAFTKALQLFDPASTNAKIMILFTDGVTTAGGPPGPVAAAAKAQGVAIYAIGLSGNSGIDEQALRDWASDPDSAFVFITPDEGELEQIFEDLAKNISRPGATQIVIHEKVTDCFQIESLSTPTRGTATRTGDGSLKWEIAELGATTTEGASLTFTVRHTGMCAGTQRVNESITYADHEGNVAVFPDPEIEVDCGIDVTPEGCPAPRDVTMEGCQDAVEFNAGDLTLDSLGRILQVTVRLKNICPNRRVALAVVVTELDRKNDEHKRGFKTLLIPAHHRTGCRDVTVRCVKFVLPEALNVSGSAASICDRRKFRVRLFANYIDNDFDCCQVLV